MYVCGVRVAILCAKHSRLQRVKREIYKKFFFKKYFRWRQHWENAKSIFLVAKLSEKNITNFQKARFFKFQINVSFKRASRAIDFSSRVPERYQQIANCNILALLSWVASCPSPGQADGRCTEKATQSVTASLFSRLNLWIYGTSKKL